MKLCRLAILFVMIGCVLCAAGQARAQDTFDQLEKLEQLAPARQLGQPGNAAIDQWVQQQFENAAQKANNQQQWEQAQALMTAADEAEDALFAKYQSMNLQASAGGEHRSSAIVRLLFEDPTALVALAILALLLVGGAWLAQRRKELLVLGGVLTAVLIGLPLAARTVETTAEREATERGDLSAAEGQVELAQAAKQAMTADLAAAKAGVSLWQTGRMEYPTAAFIPGESHLSIQGEKVRLYQLSPNLVDPGNLPDGKLNGSLIYVGDGRPGQLAAHDLHDAIVMMDFDSHNRWIDVVQRGAGAVVFVEPKAGSVTNYDQAVKKMTISPIAVPRFYIKRDDMATLAGAQWAKTLASGATATLEQQPGRWDRTMAAADWLYIPSRSPNLEGEKPFQTDPFQQLVHIQAYKDTSGIVPELSPGATSLGNLVVLKQLIDHWQKNPPLRPVLISVVNDHANHLMGEQHFAYGAFANANNVLEELDSLMREITRVRFIESVYQDAPTDEHVTDIADRVENVAGQSFKVRSPILDQLTHHRNELRTREQALRFELLDIDSETNVLKVAGDASKEEIKERIADLAARGELLNNLMNLFSPLGKRPKFSDLTEHEQAKLTEIFQQITDEARDEASFLDAATARLRQQMTLRRRLLPVSGVHSIPESAASYEQVLAQRYTALPAMAMFTLDLTFNSGKVGLFYRGHGVSETFNPRDLRDAQQRIELLAEQMVGTAQTLAEKNPELDVLEPTLSLAGGLPWSAQLGGHFDVSARVPHQYAIPALTLTGLGGKRPFLLTPDDVSSRIDRKSFDRITDFALQFFAETVDSDTLSRTRQLRGSAQPASYELRVRQQDQFSIKTPRTKVENALILAMPERPGHAESEAMLGDVRPWPILMTDRHGMAVLRGSVYGRASVQVYAYSPDFSQLVGAVDFGRGESRFTSTLPVLRSTRYEPRTIVTFESRKVDMIGLTEPLTMRPALTVQVIDARQNSIAQHYAVTGIQASGSSKLVPVARDGTGCVMVPLTMPFKLRVGDSLAINTSEESPTGEGFSPEVGRLSNIVLTSGWDMWRLTESRLDLLSDKGVTNEGAMDLNHEAKGGLEDAQTSSEGEDVQVVAEEARGLAYRAYGRGLSTVNDLIKAVVVFLALVIPFCFFIMKLLTPFTDVNRQIALFGGIFVAMVLMLHQVHPAFEVANTPHVVILAFIILGLAVFVSSVLIGRFNTTMMHAAEEMLQTEAMDAPQGRLAGVAFMVGVNNMKRRRIRTTLTCATIVLVTFTMLSVISVGQDDEPVQLRTDGESPYSGYLYARPGYAPINDKQFARLRAHFTRHGSVIGRVWGSRQSEFGDYFPYPIAPREPVVGAPQEELNAKILVGLETSEDGFVAPMPLAAGRWFSSNTAEEIILSSDAAEIIGISTANFAQQTLVLEGREMKLVGLLDGERLAQIRDLADTSLLPIVMSADQASAQKTKEGELDSFEGGADGMGAQVARPVEVAFLPIEQARVLGDGEYQTLSVKYAPTGEESQTAAASAWRDAKDFIRYQHARLAVGLANAVTMSDETKIEPGQYTLASSNATQVMGVMKVAIPIILAATIILNTMLGSVMERKREISIYNAIGLNPTHVMIFFLAESLVFGVVGSVAGYLIGQILSVAITKLDLIDLNLNYSSLSVIVVILLTVLTVLLSTVYPAAMAARAAVPSGQRKWSLPQPDGDEIEIKFPFSYDANRVLGVCAYLYDFMVQHSEASTGAFVARVGPVGLVPTVGARDDEEDQVTYAMVFDVSPAPFDLGVNQKMEVYAHYDRKVKAHMLVVHLTRTTGERNNWVTVNQPFLEALRKRLLGWRSQREQTQEQYYKQGDELFAEARKLPTRDSQDETLTPEPASVVSA